jgi:hypothetical protein
LRVELGIQDKFCRIGIEQRYFAEIETEAAMIEPDELELPL